MLMTLFRRDTIPLVAAILASPMIVARAEGAPEEIPLWPGPPPGGGAGPARQERIGRHGQVSNVRTPRLILHRPAEPNGAAVIILGGGGYHSIELGQESGPAARWLRARGVTAFELVYRLPGEGWPSNATFADGLRAVRLVRARAGQFGYDEGRIGVLGFSAGAHLAGMTAVGAAVGAYPPVDAADALSARPDSAALIYPVLTMLPPWNHTQAFTRLLGDGASLAACAGYSVERQVKPNCPPVFLAQAADDPIAPTENSVLMFAALRQAGLPAEMHIFREGGHGWGLGIAGSEVAAWPSLYATWAAQLG
jgi:acetyl esterase/lipase